MTKAIALNEIKYRIYMYISVYTVSKENALSAFIVDPIEWVSYEEGRDLKPAFVFYHFFFFF